MPPVNSMSQALCNRGASVSVCLKTAFTHACLSLSRFGLDELKKEREHQSPYRSFYLNAFGHIYSSDSVVQSHQLLSGRLLMVALQNDRESPHEGKNKMILSITMRNKKPSQQSVPMPFGQGVVAKNDGRSIKTALYQSNYYSR